MFSLSTVQRINWGTGTLWGQAQHADSRWQMGICLDAHSAIEAMLIQGLSSKGTSFIQWFIPLQFPQNTWTQVHCFLLTNTSQLVLNQEDLHPRSVSGHRGLSFYQADVGLELAVPTNIFRNFQPLAIVSDLFSERQVKSPSITDLAELAQILARWQKDDVKHVSSSRPQANLALHCSHEQTQVINLSSCRAEQSDTRIKAGKKTGTA